MCCESVQLIVVVLMVKLDKLLGDKSTDFEMRNRKHVMQ